MASFYPSCLKVLSWNIDGLDERDTIERTLAVCELIHSRTPHVVYLQEVVPTTWARIVSTLSTTYNCYSSPNPPAHYYPVLLVQEGTVEIAGSLKCFNFPHSTMGRHLLQLPVKFSGVEIQLMTSHLESTKDYASERKRQLKKAFEIMERLQQSKTCIFGGDLNVRDAEVASVGLPKNAVDVWEACGSQMEHKYTWDISENDNLDWPFPNKPKLRFDRLYLSPTDSQLFPKSFELVGRERLPSCDRFPSDHWGMWAEFEVKECV